MERGVSIRDMTSEELVDAVTEMAARVEGRFVPTEQQKSMQEKLRHELMNNPKLPLLNAEYMLIAKQKKNKG